LNAHPTLDDYQWLVSPEAGPWLAEAADGGRELVSQAADLRRRLSAQRVHLLLEQATLRLRAQRKFSAAPRMFYTPLGLAQATDEWVAAYKASRFPSGLPLLDLCCGIGGDLMALARRATVTGIDRDPIAALLAETNLRTIVGNDSQPRSAFVIVRDAAAHFPLAEVGAWHIDPDRRPTGRRTTRVELHSPGLPLLERLLAMRPDAAIKLAPAAELPKRWTLEAELEWISRGGECRQLVAWFGTLARTPGRRCATIVYDDSGNVRTFAGDPALELAVAERLGRYLAEPDPAVLAAKLTGALAHEHALAAVAPGSVYLTSDHADADGALTWFEIIDALPFDLKRLKALLRQRGIGRLEVKKRGVPHDPRQVREQLRVPGDGASTLFLTRIAGTVTAIMARRLSG
jgi:hypothetical protein